MNNKFLRVVLILLIIILVVFSSLFFKYKFFDNNEIGDTGDVPDISGMSTLDKIVTDEISKAQVVDNYEFYEAMLYSDSEKSSFSVLALRIDDDDRVLSELDIYFLDIDGVEIEKLSINIVPEDLLSNRLFIFQNIDKDLSDTYKIKYELVYN